MTVIGVRADGRNVDICRGFGLWFGCVEARWVGVIVLAEYDTV